MSFDQDTDPRLENYREVARRYRGTDACAAILGLISWVTGLEKVRRTADARSAVADWMIANGYPTGHGDTLDDLLCELISEVRWREREGVR